MPLARRLFDASYPLAKSLLFRLSPERAHHVTLDLLRRAAAADLLGPIESKLDWAPVEVMGVQFPNPVGLAAGMDKAGDCVDGLGALGFGHIEVGTVTPRPQPGNPKPRLFRLPKHDALINRMGFNNPGIDRLVENIQGRRYEGVLGINIGKNFDTPVENAIDDYLLCLRKAYPHADYITVNISSPNTAGLRDLQAVDSAKALLGRLKEEQVELAGRHGKHVPLAVKIAPDLADDDIKTLAEMFLEIGLDGVIATNTTIERSTVAGDKFAGEKGGLSGLPVRTRATEVVSILAGALGNRIPVIGVGGVSDGASAAEKLNAGAKLVQVYTGLIYGGSGLLSEIRRGDSP
ncbi:MAG: quinone-dependent dihydroorotate dehydrogenase [Verrucomicrobiota bacterium]